jgi:cell division transport system permease protein
MRLTVWLVGVLAAAGVAGCTSAPSTEPVDIVVFLDADPTEAQLQEIEAELRAVPGASGLTFESGEEAYERFRELFTDSPELVETVTVDSLPDSYRFTLADHTTADPIIADLGQLPGVTEVVKTPAAGLPLPTR